MGEVVLENEILVAFVLYSESTFALNVERDHWQDYFSAVEQKLRVGAFSPQSDHGVRLGIVVYIKWQFVLVFFVLASRVSFWLEVDLDRHRVLRLYKTFCQSHREYVLVLEGRGIDSEWERLAVVRVSECYVEGLGRDGVCRGYYLFIEH